ncbi:MAG: DUF2274 domain-containing protein [Magnetospirillum sp.]|nr:DUF2274 domain-containing protein [Magnetospirillum sp.]
MLKLAKLPDRTPVKITIAVSPELNGKLAAYAALYRAAYGTTEPVAELIPYMLEGFLDADKGFVKARKDVGEAPVVPPPLKRPGRPPRLESAPPRAAPETASGREPSLPTT